MQNHGAPYGGIRGTNTGCGSGVASIVLVARGAGLELGMLTMTKSKVGVIGGGAAERTGRGVYLGSWCSGSVGTAASASK